MSLGVVDCVTVCVRDNPAGLLLVGRVALRIRQRHFLPDWTGPKVVDGLKIEGTFRAHQVPLLVDAAHPDHVKVLESWMKSYRAEELFDANGALKASPSPRGRHSVLLPRFPMR
jgi:hypothetical protein